MEKLTKVKMILIDGGQLKADEAMDIGAYYYVLKGKDVLPIKKSNVAHIECKTRTQENDSSKYIKDNDEGSCITGSC